MEESDELGPDAGQIQGDEGDDETRPLLDSAELYHPNMYRRITRRIIGMHYFTDPVSTCYRYIQLSPQSRFENFLKGLQFYFFVLWPSAFGAMFLHDAIVYWTQPSYRYGNTFDKILLGTSPNQLTITAMLGSDLALEGEYWTFLALPFAALIFGIVGACVKRYPKYANAKYPNELLEALRANSPFYQSLASHISSSYLLWAHGYPPTENSYLNMLIEPVYWVLNGLILLANLRLTWLVIWKFMNLVRTLENKARCEAEDKIFAYMSAFGDYVCGMCSDWQFVFPLDVFSSQGCINGLLADERTPDFISQHLEQLLKRAQPYFDRVDFSKQNWRNWTNTEWQDVLTRISFKQDRLSALNLSCALPNDSDLDYKKLSTLSEFSKNVSLSLLDMHNQYIGSTYLNNFTLSLNQQNLTYLDLSNVGMEDDQFITLSRNVHQKILEVLKVARNQITDYGIAQSQNSLTNASIIYFDVSYNNLTLCTDSLGALIGSKNLSALDISGNDFSAANFGPFWQASANGSSLISLSVSYAGISDLQLLDAIPYLGNTSIKEWDLQNNQLSDYGVTNFFNGLIVSDAEVVDVSGNLISNIGLSAIGECLPDLTLDFLGLSRLNTISADGVSPLINGVVNSTVDSITLNGNYLDNDSILVMTNILKNSTGFLTSIDLSKNLFSEFDSEFILRSDIEILILNTNPLSDSARQSLIRNVGGSSIKTLGLNHVGLTGIDAIALGSEIPDSFLEDIDIGNNPIGDTGMFSIAKALIRSIANKGRLGDKHINIDQSRWLHHHAKPNSRLRFFDAGNTSIADTSARALCRILAPANISLDDVNLLPNKDVKASEVNLVNCRFDDKSQISQSTTHFFAPQPIQVRVPSQSIPALPGGQMNNMNLGSVFIMGFAMVPPMIFSLLAIYLIYKAVNVYKNANTVNDVNEANDPEGKSYATKSAI